MNNKQIIEEDTLLAILSAATMAVLGENTKIIKVEYEKEYEKFSSWINYGRIQQFYRR